MQDDPVCVAARKDKKKVVTEQWVQDSFELGYAIASLPTSSDCVCSEQ